MPTNRINTEILLGAIFIVISAVMLLYIGFTEEVSLEKAEGQQVAESIEVGGELYVTNCARCHGEYGEGGLGAPFNTQHFFEGRMREVGWEGSVRDFLIATARSGRPASTRPEQYPGDGTTPWVMPAWSQDFGGPLRNDQIANIADYIMNFQVTATGEVAAKVPIALPGPLLGDPVLQGQRVYIAQGCAACHAIDGLSNGVIGPDLTHIATDSIGRVDGMSVEEYLRESILEPAAFMVADCPTGDCPDNVMPPDFDEKMAGQDLENLVLFLLTLE
jgi:mono/diheme cytochrome c family protein